MKKSRQKKLLSRYICGDARELLKYLGPNSTQLFVTSPPYFDLLNYGSDPRQIGHGYSSYEAYLQEIRSIFREAFECAKDSGALWIIIDTFKRDGVLKFLPADVARECEKGGWKCRDISIWNKGKTLPWSRKGQLRNQFEYVLFFTKSDKYKYHLDRIRDAQDLKEWWVKYPERYSPNGKAPTNIWDFPIPVQGSWTEVQLKHSCPVPPQMAERIISLCSDRGDLVADPFAGSGTALAQAHLMGRRYFGIDNQDKYRKYFYRTVLPLIAGRPSEDKKGAGPLGQSRLFSLIWKLRMLKYPYQLAQLLERNLGTTLWQGAIVDSSGDISNNAISEVPFKCTLIARRAIPKKTLALALELLAVPPLSKYGLKPSLEIISMEAAERLLKKMGKARGIYLYRGRRTYSYVQQWKKGKLPAALLAEKNFVTLSPIDVDLQIPRT